MAFKWQHPEWLWIGPVLFLAVLLISILFNRWRNGVWRTLGLKELGGTLTTGARGNMRFFTRHILLALAVGCAGMSLANLQMGGQKQLVERRGADVVFALDVSRSMMAEDIAPNRLDKAKLLISRTIDNLGGDRVGLVAYAGNAYPALPITTDYAAAKMSLISADPDQIPTQGTNLSSALEFAQEYFNPASPAGRFIIVMTDGEDHEFSNSPIKSDLPINIMVVGVGTAKGGPIPISKKNNGTSYKKDNDGQVVITKRDDAVLQDITGILGARYIDGNRTDEAIRSIMEFIEEGEKSDIKEEIAMNYDSQFMWFLYPAILFLLMYILLPHRVRAIAIILCLVSFNNAQGQNMHRYGSEVRQGNDSYENEEWLEAVSSYDKAAVEQPDEFIPKFNRGTALMKAGDLQGAAQSFMDAAQSTENASDQSDAYYNLGNLLMEAGQYQEAAGAYIESLSRQPKRKDAIYNLNRAIEQLRQQEQQEQEQEQEQEQDQDEQSNEDSNNPNEEPQEEQPDQDNSKKDQNEQSDGEDNTEESNPESQQDDQGNEGEQPEPSEGGEEKVKMTPEEIKGLLEAIQRAEEKTAEKMNAKKVKGKKKSGEKDW